MTATIPSVATNARRADLVKMRWSEARSPRPAYRATTGPRTALTALKASTWSEAARCATATNAASLGPLHAATAIVGTLAITVPDPLTNVKGTASRHQPGGGASTPLPGSVAVATLRWTNAP